MNRAEAQADLTNRLVAAGHLIPPSVPGICTFTGEFESVLRAVDLLIHEREPHFTEVGVPPFLPESDFVRTGYVHSFPNLMGSVNVFTGTPRDHRAMLSDMDQQEDWTAHLRPAHIDLLSAPCHSTYPMHARQTLDGAKAYDIHSRCWRHEPSADPMRLTSFRMREKVLIGDPEQALAHRSAGMDIGSQIMHDLGLDVRSVVANDPFFGRAAKIMVEGQRESELKFEFVCRIYDCEDGDVALGSANYHQDHFGVDFEITTAAGGPAHSSCFGFGLERLTIALFATHGMDSASWPAPILSLLQLAR